jgi:PleD family two-component response regulator
MATGSLRRGAAHASKLWRLQSAHEADAREPVLLVDDQMVAMLLGDYVAEIGGFRLDVAATRAEALRRLRYFCAVVSHALQDAAQGTAVDALDALGVPTIVQTRDTGQATFDRLRGHRIVDYVVMHGAREIEHVAYLLGRPRENRRRKVLVVDPALDYRNHLAALLERCFCSTLLARDGAEALAVLQANPDLTLVSTSLDFPQGSGFDLIGEVHRRYRREELAIIGLTDDTTAGVPARILQAGGNDFLPKAFEIGEFYCRVTQNTHMVGSLRQIRDSANQDFLTGLCDRRHLFERGDKLHARARHGRIHLAASIIDADHFKRINDAYGHQAGEVALQALRAGSQRPCERTTRSPATAAKSSSVSPYCKIRSRRAQCSSACDGESPRYASLRAAGASPSPRALA